ncbi:murein hydrolase activator EnvC family protein [Lichenihabitans psoromatis]|uniref:murein hydrolase activator EnvC family protein n=1 Tax=Lichenihabitans psoromatis TaxID=2528642 RepID=UPI0010383A79|nr:peptidoglycan DD-metalloendopeptidase family protein [Lichenihabitans psoromatis]
MTDARRSGGRQSVPCRYGPAILLAVVAAGVALPVAAQDAAPNAAQSNASVAATPDSSVTASLPATTATARDQQIDARKQELRSLQDNLSVSDAERHKIVADIEAIRTDRVRLNAALLETTQHVQDAERKVGEAQRRLDTMTGSEDAIKQSLEGRRGVIAEVLAALQRMGRKPPPAILVRPDDILKSIRTSMLLGAVVPELRSEAEALASDLSDLQRLRFSIAGERDRLASEIAGLGNERARLDGLIVAKQAAQTEAEAALGSQQGRAADLARRATSLQDLISRMENEVASARHAGDAARAADEERRKAAAADADSIRAKVAAGPFRDPARLTPAVDFADAKAMLFLPSTGRVVKRFGTADDFGGTEKGMSLATPARAVVAAPSDGWVAFSGPYRTYGQILIINAGSGYYIVLAGMSRVNVAPGHFVLAGEPVATMGDGSVKTAASIALGAADPILYVEFRKDGTAVDPSPWWAKADLEKVRG